MTNRAAAIRIFWEEFPTTKPANLDDATALKNSVHIMDRFLEKALQDQPEGARLGEFIKTNWQNTHAAFVKLGTLKGTEAADRFLHGTVHRGLQRLRPRRDRGTGEEHGSVIASLTEMVSTIHTTLTYASVWLEVARFPSYRLSSDARLASII